jgi:hypothetical protein
MNILVRRKTIVKEFAMKIAELNRRSDEWYYKDIPPKKNTNYQASWLLDQIIPLNQMCQKLGIREQVYKEAYKIYDFRNSGKNGYALINGKIVKHGGGGSYMTNAEAIEVIKSNWPCESYTMLREALKLSIEVLEKEIIIELADKDSGVIKPVRGLKPKWLHDEQRITDIKRALQDRINALQTIPMEWVDEYKEFIRLADKEKKI